MAYQPLHHKYRPQTFAQLVGQGAIATTLSNALEQQRIAPAYLFSGPRGTGKTSSARILAKSLNCLNAAQPTSTPCGTCEVCQAIANGSALDVIEIDAASNTGVDNIRELIERAQFAPVQCRYKVYVIDECHMLSVAAFNALLKTLEEPPRHVVFVLATTDPQRVLPTIISRCQRFDYQRIPVEAMVRHLGEIARLESIDIPIESITLIAQIANGGLRDAESLLDQLSLLSGEISPDRVWDLVGAVPELDLLALLQVIRADEPDAVMQHCRTLLNRGREPLIVLQNLANFYLNLLIAKTAPQRADLIAVTQPTWEALCHEAQAWTLSGILQGQQQLKVSESQLKNTTQPRLWLEITLLGLLPSALQGAGAIASAQGTPTQPASPIATQPQITSQEPTPPSAIRPAMAQAPPQSVTPASGPSTSGLSPSPPSESGQPSPTPLLPQSGDPPSMQATPPAAVEHSSSPTISAMEREELWQGVVRELPPLSRSLFKEHGKLLALSELAASVGIKSSNLLKIASRSVPALEESFQKICDRTIKVNLQVGFETEGEGEVPDPGGISNHGAIASPSDPAPQTEPIAAPAPQSWPSYTPADIPTPPTNSAPTQPIAAAPTPGRNSPPVQAASAGQVRQPAASQVGHDSPLPITPASVTVTEPSPELDAAENADPHGVTEQFAALFDGEIIELTHLAPATEANTASLERPVVPDSEPPANSPKSVAPIQGRPQTPVMPDDDIPF